MAGVLDWSHWLPGSSLVCSGHDHLALQFWVPAVSPTQLGGVQKRERVANALRTHTCSPV